MKWQKHQIDIHDFGYSGSIHIHKRWFKTIKRVDSFMRSLFLYLLKEGFLGDDNISWTCFYQKGKYQTSMTFISEKDEHFFA